MKKDTFGNGVKNIVSKYSEKFYVHFGDYLLMIERDGLLCLPYYKVICPVCGKELNSLSIHYFKSYVTKKIYCSHECRLKDVRQFEEKEMDKT